MGKGFAELDAMVEKLEALPELVKRAAPEAAKAIELDLHEQIARAEAPDGEAWKPRKDGGEALQTAAKSLAVAAIGTKVVCKLTGHVARHHKGRVNGGVKRQILPAGKLPESMVSRIRKVMETEFQRTMK